MRANPWIIVFVGFVALSVSFAFRAVLGLSIPEWERTVSSGGLGWSRDTISAASALALSVMAVLYPFVGALVDRIGARIVVSGGCLLLAVAMTFVGNMSSPWHLALAFGVLGGVAFTLVGNNVVTVMVARVFDTRLGLATGIATSGSTAGQLAMMPLLTLGFVALGWRHTYFVVAGVCVLIACTAWWLLGGESGRTKVKTAGPARVSLLEATRILFRDPGFYALFVSFFICGITTTGIIETHFIPFAIACGFAPMLSAMSYSVLSGFNFTGMAISGWASDRFNRSWMLGGIYAGRGISFFILLGVGDSYPMLIGFAILFGLMEYSTFPPTAGLVVSRYGVANMGKAMGFLMAAHSIGAAIGAWGAGRVYTVFGSYDWAWIGCAATAFGAALVVLACKDPRHTGPHSGFRMHRVPAPA